jgi:hypothetical protein
LRTEDRRYYGARAPREAARKAIAAAVTARREARIAAARKPYLARERAAAAAAARKHVPIEDIEAAIAAWGQRIAARVAGNPIRRGA